MQVLKYAEWVSSISTHCTVGSSDSIKKAAAAVDESKIQAYSFDNWKASTLHPQTMDSSTAEFIFLLDLLNFSFWSPEGDVPFTVEGYTGYQSLCALIQRALREGTPVTSASWMASATE
jgi:hypothetical protein